MSGTSPSEPMCALWSRSRGRSGRRCLRTEPDKIEGRRLSEPRDNESPRPCCHGRARSRRPRRSNRGGRSVGRRARPARRRRQGRRVPAWPSAAFASCRSDLQRSGRHRTDRQAARSTSRSAAIADQRLAVRLSVQRLVGEVKGIARRKRPICRRPSALRRTGVVRQLSIGLFVISTVTSRREGKARAGLVADPTLDAGAASSRSANSPRDDSAQVRGRRRSRPVAVEAINTETGPWPGLRSKAKAGMSRP